MYTIVGVVVILMVTVNSQLSIAEEEELAQGAQVRADSVTATSLFAPSARFSGKNFRELHKKFVVTPKGEFETSKEYQERAKNSSSDVFAFRLPSSGIHVYAKYDADKGQFAITIGGESLISGYDYDSNRTLLIVDESDEETGSYVGSNAFGVTANIREWTKRQWGISIDRESYRPLELVLEVSPEYARLLKDNLCVVVECSLSPVVVPEVLAITGDATGYSSSKPTLELPVDITKYQYAIPARVFTYWIFNRKSGELLGKYAANGSIYR